MKSQNYCGKRSITEVKTKQQKPSNLLDQEHSWGRRWSEQAVREETEIIRHFVVTDLPTLSTSFFSFFFFFLFETPSLYVSQASPEPTVLILSLLGSQMCTASQQLLSIPPLAAKLTSSFLSLPVAVCDQGTLPVKGWSRKCSEDLWLGFCRPWK